jgi:hypothetical protein
VGAAIFHLIYMSAASPMKSTTLDDILEASERNNAARNITGLLIYRLGHFIQLLEGNKPDVLAAFEQIAADGRHSGARVLLAFESDERLFPQWRMGHVRDGVVTSQLFSSLQQLYNSATVEGGDPRTEALAILRDFSRESRER